jgi:hypothetical protein
MGRADLKEQRKQKGQPQKSVLPFAGGPCLCPVYPSAHKPPAMQHSGSRTRSRRAGRDIQLRLGFRGGLVSRPGFGLVREAVAPQ